MEQITYKPNVHGHKVLTPDGYKLFAGIRCIGYRPIVRVEFEYGYWLECTDNHKLFVNQSSRVPVSQLSVGKSVLTKTGFVNVLDISDTGKNQLVYDLVEVDGGHRYYTNGVLSSNCEFLIWEETLISATTLIDLQAQEPLYHTGQVRWYQQPERGRIYVVALDPSLGTGGDPAAIQVFEANSTRQIGEWRHNRTDIPTQIRILADIVKHLHEHTQDQNSIYYSIENNTIGEAALISIAEYGEENIPGYFLSDNSVVGTTGRRFRKGFNTTPRAKLTACNKLKILVESRRLRIASQSLISELKTFIAHGVSYAAKPGEHDDLVMATILAVRMMQLLQTYHPEMDAQMKDHGDQRLDPMPFISIMR